MRKTGWVVSALIAVVGGCATGASAPPPVAASTMTAPPPVLAHPQVSAMASAAAPVAQTSCGGGGGDFVTQKIQWLTAFDFNNNGGTGLNPPVDPNHPPSNNPYKAPVGTALPAAAAKAYHQELEDAFTIAPPWVQKRLCDVTQLFIIPTSLDGAVIPAAWSFWETNSQNPANRTFIALSQTFLDRHMSLQDVEMQTAAAPLILGPNVNNMMRITVGEPAANTQAMAVLALWTHELGHILIWKENPAAWTDCGVGSYFWKTWFNPGARPRIHFFARPISGETPALTKPIDQIRAEIGAADYADAINDMKELYSGNWSNAFGAIAYDFDLTQTLTLLALTTSRTPLKTLNVELAYPLPAVVHPGINIVGLLNGGQLRQKISCLASHQNPLPGAAR